MLSKQKNIEVRILKEKSEKIKAGDYITFYNQEHKGQYIKVKVIDKDIFDNIEQLLKKYDVNNIMPNHTTDELKIMLNQIYGEELITKKLVALKFEYISSEENKNEEND